MCWEQICFCISRDSLSCWWHQKTENQKLTKTTFLFFLFFFLFPKVRAWETVWHNGWDLAWCSEKYWVHLPGKADCWRRQISLAREEVMNELHVSNTEFVSLLLKSLHQTAKLVHCNQKMTYLFQGIWNRAACTLFFCISGIEIYPLCMASMFWCSHSSATGTGTRVVQWQVLSSFWVKIMQS